jgi:protein-tyrosine phosphatase
MKPLNFRDVGESVNRLASRCLLPSARLYRSGRLKGVCSPDEIGHPGMIINLREIADNSSRLSGCYLHFPLPDRTATYDPQNRVTKKWMCQIFRRLATPPVPHPILICCASGKDRTGVVIGVLLKVLGIPEDTILSEYLLSKGDLDGAQFTRMLSALGKPQEYFDGIDLDDVRRLIIK